MVTKDRVRPPQDLCDGLSKLLGPEFSAAEVYTVASALPETVHPELADASTREPAAPSSALGKAVLESLVDCGIFDAKFGSAVIKDEFDAPSRESLEDLYSMTATSQQLREA
ncbi:hypothetical protein [Brevibacterium aurantiacum]|uniref:Uncharacterized protein n=1 Tax=Brevibacterium aurantiacum TaxID=273384 RepID=A0A2H1KMV7_BREAU|nr:hypothetical protein [Brevibacterium aurantiacum]SMY01070.1 hypothetical protein BAUR920_03374 [Brevibacterium aurantiacum]